MAKAPNYQDGVAYWSSQPTTVDGMLGGYGTGRVPRLDVQHSTLFLRQLVSSKLLNARLQSDTTSRLGSEEEDDRVVRTVDCGAGIGRVTRDLLLQFSDIVDLVEPCVPFTQVITTGDDLASARRDGKIGDVVTAGLQDFVPPQRYYTIIWCQWCLGQLTDVDLVAFLDRCRTSLVTPGGLVFVKENIAQGDTNIFDEQDSSWTRTEDAFLTIFKSAGLTVVKSSVQHGFPKELFKVKLWALK